MKKQLKAILPVALIQWYRDIQTALQNIRRSGCTYLLTTTFNQLPKNKNIITGEWRPVNLQQEPFLLPPPLLLLTEQSDSSDGIARRHFLERSFRDRTKR